MLINAKICCNYTLYKIDKEDKNKKNINKIKEIIINNKERYGYCRITIELKNQDYNVNYKKVYRIIAKLELKILKEINENIQHIKEQMVRKQNIILIENSM